MVSFPKHFRFSALTAALAFFAFTVPALCAASDLASGTAKGSLTFGDSTVALNHAAAFVDQKDERKPVVLVLSDKKMASEKWTTGSDISGDAAKFNGIVFYLDKEGKMFRTDVRITSRWTAVSGLFDVKIDNPSSKEITGSAISNEGQKSDKLDVTFHATLK